MVKAVSAGEHKYEVTDEPLEGKARWRVVSGLIMQVRE